MGSLTYQLHRYREAAICEDTFLYMRERNMRLGIDIHRDYLNNPRPDDLDEKLHRTEHDTESR